jgi:hypothetical protein
MPSRQYPNWMKMDEGRARGSAGIVAKIARTDARIESLRCRTTPEAMDRASGIERGRPDQPYSQSANPKALPG